MVSGFILGTVICAKAGLPPPLVAVCMAGALFPDTDIDQSLAGRLLPLWRWFKPHRKNPTHSLNGLCMFSLAWLPFAGLRATLIFAAGYLVHLLLDSCTPMGVPWLWPDTRMFRICKVRGPKWELIILFGFYTILIAVANW
jgi:membrane-bound metal-dependent hydrolase YbcI (DUF457 family)